MKPKKIEIKTDTMESLIAGGKTPKEAVETLIQNRQIDRDTAEDILAKYN